jgi:hypothetical protein
VNAWKWQHVAKGALTWIPPLDAWRRRRLSSGGSGDPRYCYAVWLRHLVTLSRHGFDISDARVGELGPGDSIACGLAALLSGARSYVGLDVVGLAPARSEVSLDAIAQLFRERAAIPDDRELPRVRPKLDSYAFPEELVDTGGLDDRVERIRASLRDGATDGLVDYRAPWSGVAELEPGTLDLVFTQAVLEYVPLEETYGAMSAWLRPGGYGSHVVDLSAHYLAPVSNGHWAYSDLEWRLACGRRETRLNREPLGRHLEVARAHGFEIVASHTDVSDDALPADRLARRFRSLDPVDVRTRGVVLILRRQA